MITEVFSLTSSTVKGLTVGCALIGALEGVYHGSHMMHQVLLMMNKMIQ